MSRCRYCCPTGHCCWQTVNGAAAARCRCSPVAAAGPPCPCHGCCCGRVSPQRHRLPALQTGFHSQAALAPPSLDLSAPPPLQPACELAQGRQTVAAAAAAGLGAVPPVPKPAVLSAAAATRLQTSPPGAAAAPAAAGPAVRQQLPLQPAEVASARLLQPAAAAVSCPVREESAPAVCWPGWRLQGRVPARLPLVPPHLPQAHLHPVVSQSAQALQIPQLQQPAQPAPAAAGHQQPEPPPPHPPLEAAARPAAAAAPRRRLPPCCRAAAAAAAHGDTAPPRLAGHRELAGAAPLGEPAALSFAPVVGGDWGEGYAAAR